MNYSIIYEQLTDRLRGYNLPWEKEVAILGSVNTLNTGDLAIVKSVKKFILKHTGKDAKVLSWRHFDVKGFSHIIVCGGDVLHDRDRSNLKKLKTLLENNNKVSFLGVGVPGFYLTPKETVFQVLSKAHRIIVRDEVSYKRLLAIGLENVVSSFDNAFLLAGLNNKANHKEDQHKLNKVGVSIKTYTSAQRNSIWTQEKQKITKKYYSKNIQQLSLEDYINNYQKVIDQLKSQNLEINIIPFTKEDELFCKKYFNDLSMLPYTKNYFKLLKSVSLFGKIFFTRYHSFVFALVSGCSINGFAYADKLDNLLSAVNIESTINREDWLMRDLTLRFPLRFSKIPRSRIQEMEKVVTKNILEIL